MSINFRPLKSMRGMSLVEILIVLGLLGALASGMMTLSKYMYDSTRAMDQKLTINSLMSELQILTSGAATCTQAISLDADGNPAPQTFDNSLISDPKLTQELRLRLGKDKVIDGTSSTGILSGASIAVKSLYIGEAKPRGFDNFGNPTYTTNLYLLTQDAHNIDDPANADK